MLRELRLGNRLACSGERVRSSDRECERRLGEHPPAKAPARRLAGGADHEIRAAARRASREQPRIRLRRQRYHRLFGAALAARRTDRNLQ
jgi:hypothetical protein